MRGSCLSFVALAAVLMGGENGLAQSTLGNGGGILLAEAGHGGLSDHSVKGLPYSLVETFTSQRMLADGTKIDNTHEERIMRDSEGRERRETSLIKDGKPELTSIFIMDPLNRTSTILMPRMKIAHVNHLPQRKVLTQEEEARGAEARAKAEAARKEHQAQPGMEDLGAQAIAGVVVEGRRRTMVIPAGRMGNDREIKVVTETWTSPELKIILSSTTDDPRLGKMTAVVTEVKRGEPAAALFTIPADYKVEERSLGLGGLAH
ncbi:hypothetical protein AciX9_2119 [Granulicella tundricola MP5ACTX9]|uniref:DUF4412 domain-containing protein n=2 Tax=Granulicella TaxID=940557 RepID=E8X202_GRATM|nr:hypothetical protein AciX9_2119 [Granulicella tundricola MP5ACTX9]